MRTYKPAPYAVDEFDKKLWMAVVDKVTVLPDGRLVFWFKDETEIEQ